MSMYNPTNNDRVNKIYKTLCESCETLAKEELHKGQKGHTVHQFYKMSFENLKKFIDIYNINVDDEYKRDFGQMACFLDSLRFGNRFVSLDDTLLILKELEGQCYGNDDIYVNGDYGAYTFNKENEPLKYMFQIVIDKIYIKKYDKQNNDLLTDYVTKTLPHIYGLQYIIEDDRYIIHYRNPIPCCIS